MSADAPNNLPTKELLERQRIKAEIDEINKPFYQKKEFYTSMLPILLGIVGLIFSWASGYFDVKLEKIEVEKAKLDAQIDDRIKVIDSLQSNLFEIEQSLERAQEARIRAAEASNMSDMARHEADQQAHLAQEARYRAKQKFTLLSIVLLELDPESKHYSLRQVADILQEDLGNLMHLIEAYPNIYEIKGDDIILKDLKNDEILKELSKETE